MRQRCVNFQSFTRNGLLLMGRHKFHGAHIVQSIRQLNQNYANVTSHSKEHFTIVFDLTVFFRNIGNLTQFSNAIYKICNNCTKDITNIIKGIFSIFYNIVQESSSQSIFIHLQACQNAGNTNGVNDVRFAGFTTLLLMSIRRQNISATHKVNLFIV